MNRRLSAFGGTLRRFLPIFIGLTVVVLAYVLFIEPRIAAMLRWQADARALENRVATARASLDRASRMPAAGPDETTRQFETRMPAEDKVADVIELLARRASDPKAPGRLRGLLIEAGQRVSVAGPQMEGSTGDPRVVAPPSEPQAAVDPRLALFGRPFDYTPISLSFLSTYDRVGDFLWRCRDLPTTVEIRTVEITRGLPLVKVRMTLFVYQRLATADGATPSPSAPVAAAPVAD